MFAISRKYSALTSLALGLTVTCAVVPSAVAAPGDKIDGQGGTFPALIHSAWGDRYGNKLTTSPSQCIIALAPERASEAELGITEGQQSLCQSPVNGALVPAMTSNTAPSGTVTSSGVYDSTYQPWKAFDGTTSTIWLSNMYTSSVWIDYEWGGGASNTVNSYQIKYANGSCCEQRGPKNWTLQGWDGTAWVTVSTVTNQSGWYSNPTRTYTVDTPGAYSRYRLNVTADNYNNATYPIT
ncbi:MAG: hypothetical protein H7Y22_16505, partial [Gemmatimonadaceae bacterium]|nr:hypothetical protein [Gloeobacterales cyanobacterium ES-bin-141]